MCRIIAIEEDPRELSVRVFVDGSEFGVSFEPLDDVGFGCGFMRHDTADR